MTSGRPTPHTAIHELIIEFVGTKTGDPAEDKQKQVGDEATPSKQKAFVATDP